MEVDREDDMGHLCCYASLTDLESRNSRWYLRITAVQTPRVRADDQGLNFPIPVWDDFRLDYSSASESIVVIT